MVTAPRDYYYNYDSVLTCKVVITSCEDPSPPWLGRDGQLSLPGQLLLRVTRQIRNSPLYFSCCCYLVTSTGEAGNVGGKNQRENTHVCEDLTAEVISKVVVRLK